MKQNIFLNKDYFFEQNTAGNNHFFLYVYQFHIMKQKYIKYKFKYKKGNLKESLHIN